MWNDVVCCGALLPTVGTYSTRTDSQVSTYLSTIRYVRVSLSLQFGAARAGPTNGYSR